nr:MMPL family transporter [Micromonospora sp. DSM 115978]
MSVYLHRLGRFCFRRRRLVVGLWLVAIVGAVVAALVTDGTTSNDYTIPGTESNTTQEVLQQQFPDAAGAVSTVVFAVPAGQGVRDPAAEPLIEQARQQLEKVPRVLTVTDPLSAQSVSSDGRVAYGQVIYDAPTADLPTSVFNDLDGAVATARASGVQVEFTGQVYPGYGEPESDLPSEIVGLVVALLVLLVTFGALAAAGLPLVSALAGVAVGLASITAISSAVSLISAAPTMAIMLGLAC